MKRERNGHVRTEQDMLLERQRVIHALSEKIDAQFLVAIQHFSTDNLKNLLADLPLADEEESIEDDSG